MAQIHFLKVAASTTNKDKTLQQPGHHQLSPAADPEGYFRPVSIGREIVARRINCVFKKVKLENFLMAMKLSVSVNFEDCTIKKCLCCFFCLRPQPCL